MSLDLLEIKHRLDGSRVEFACQPCLVHPGRHAAVLYRLDRDWQIPQVGLIIPAGSLSTGFFWEAKPFNLYHWMTPQGETIGDYFNLAAETRITASTVEWLDLLVDYCLVPGKDGSFLDENEIPAGLEFTILQQIRAGCSQLTREALRISRWAERLSARILVTSIDSNLI